MLGFGFSLTDQNKITAAAVAPWYLSGGVDPSGCVAAYQAKGASSYAESKVNLANPGTYDLIDGLAYPTWDSVNGWAADGTSQYLDTGLTNLDLNNENATIIISYSNFISTGSLFCGYIETNIPGYDWQEYGILLETDPDARLSGRLYNHRETNWGPGILYPSPSFAVLSLNKSYLYRDGTPIVSIIPIGSFANLTIASIYLFAEHYIDDGGDYGASLFCKVNILAASFYNTSLTDSQVAAITTAIQAL